jgi:dipeptidyl aminopeptidase/acylaminoacyl peptidase
VQAVAAWSAVFDFALLLRESTSEQPEWRYLDCRETCSEAQVSLASPIRFVDASDPPFLLVHGAKDGIVSVEQSRAFHWALKEAGAKSELLILEDVDHSFLGASPEATREASLRALAATVDFFDCRFQRKSCRPAVE